MKRITYRITFGSGHVEIVEVYARSINSGFAKALGRAKRLTLAGEDLARIEFWEVRS